MIFPVAGWNRFLPRQRRFLNGQKISHVLNEYQRKLQAQGINVKRIILHGSHAVGKAKEESDIDLVVISDDFKQMDL